MRSKGLPSGTTASTVTQPPAISSLSPVSATAGGAAFALTIVGSNFTSASTLKWGSILLKTSYVSAARLTAAIPASLIATPGTASITVITAAGNSSSAAFTITLPPPAITSLNPATAIAGRAFTMTINGRNFFPLATARWGSAPLVTTYVSATQITAAVPANMVAASGRAFVTVSTAGGTSPAAALAITQPAPSITSLSPGSVVAGGPALALTIYGTNFLPGAGATIARWNNVALATTYVNCGQLTAIVPDSLTGGPAIGYISVVTTGGSSAYVVFTVNPAQPVITGLSPDYVPAGIGDFSLYIFGANLSTTATVKLGTTTVSSSPLGSGVLVAWVPANLVASVGTIDVTVTTSGGTSAPMSLGINQPRPTITSLSPPSVAAGSNDFTLTINGVNFAKTAQAMVGTTPLHVTYISNTQLTVVVPSWLIASAGQTGVVVYVPGIQVSAQFPFTIKPAPPTVASLSPATVTAGGAGFMLNISGKVFTPASKTMWGTTILDTTYVSPTQLIAAVPASLIVESGTGSVTVSTPAGTSAAVSLPIKPAVPSITSLNPGVVDLGAAAFTLTIDGSYFTPTSTAKWGSTPLAITYISETQLTASIPAKLVSSAGTASITVTTAVGTSAPAGFTIYPPPRITTAALPGATAGNAYSGAIKVTGGVPGYAWTVTGLPDNMSYFNTSGSTLTIVGTPAEPGTLSFKVSVADTVGVTVGPVPYTISVANGPNGANNGSLNGNYVCLLQGFVDDDGSRWASLASFQADGKGHFVSGVYDTNSEGVGSASGTIDGSYNVGSDNHGLASLHTILTDGAAGIQTTQWAVALTGLSQPAQQFRMVEADDLGERPSGLQASGQCFLASPTAFSDSTISGSSFVFNLEGENGSGNLKAEAGLFSASAGKIVSGSIDQAQGGNAAIQSQGLTGAYSAPDPATGRFKIALKGSGRPAGFTIYIIDAKRMFILDNTSNDGEAAGNMRTQQQISSSAAKISGPLVSYMRGAEFNSSGNTPSGFFADLFEAAGDGDGNITIGQGYSNDNGVYSSGHSNQCPLSLVFDAAHPGRATFQSAGGTTYLYLFDTKSALEMSVGENGSLASGWMEVQTQGEFSNAAIAGDYLFGQLQQLNVKADGSVGKFTVGASGSIDASLTTAGDGLLTWDQAASMSYSWDATAPGTGTFLVANGAQGAASCAVVNASRFVCIPQSDPSPSVQIVEQ